MKNDDTLANLRAIEHPGSSLRSLQAQLEQPQANKWVLNLSCLFVQKHQVQGAKKVQDRSVFTHT
jgi:hypothetical protein